MAILFVYAAGFASGFAACLWRREIAAWFGRTWAHMRDPLR